MTLLEALLHALVLSGAEGSRQGELQFVPVVPCTLELDVHARTSRLHTLAVEVHDQRPFCPAGHTYLDAGIHGCVTGDGDAHLIVVGETRAHAHLERLAIHMVYEGGGLKEVHLQSIGRN